MSGSSAHRAAQALRRPDAVWQQAPSPDAEQVEALVAALRLPEPVCRVLAVRGLTDPDDAKAFLRPEVAHLHDPALLADGEAAARRISQAIDAGETILVHGDYDVDGVCAATLLTRWLRGLGGRVEAFVPHRVRDGYDFGPAGLNRARETGAGLVVTADCGSVAHEAIGAAAEAGLDVVVTDHHTIQGPPPPALAVVNPNRLDCAYPDKGLCGAAVAWKVAHLVGRVRGADPAELDAFLDLVALATVADLVPLVGENRVLVHYGLRRFPYTRVPGVAALLSVAGVDPEAVTAGSLGFTVAPRINAAGRLGDAADALRLLLTDDGAEARRLAGALESMNKARQEEDQRTLDEALDLLRTSFRPEQDFGVVLAREGWHPGVIGIVASRIVERIHRPTVLVSLDGEGGGRGSARSIPGFHLYEAVEACRGHLRRFGGHRQAAGMDVEAGAVDAFRAAFNAEARLRLGGVVPRPTLRTDLRLSLTDLTLDLAHWLQYLGPHGMGNPRPIFAAGPVLVDGVREVGRGHLKMVLRQDGATVDAIGFRMAERHPPESVGEGLWEAAFRVERNEWRDRVRVQANLVDLRRWEG